MDKKREKKNIVIYSLNGNNNLKNISKKINKEYDKDTAILLTEGESDAKYFKEVFNYISKNNEISIDKYNQYVSQFNNKYENSKNSDKDFYIFVQNKINYDKAIEIFSKNLKYFMSKDGKNVTDLSNDLHLSYSTVNDWYNGKNYPRPDKINLLANYFNISTSDLTEEQDKHTDNTKNNGSVIVPVLGRIPAGIPLEAIEEIIDYEEIPAKWLNGDKQFFALKIKDNSMAPFIQKDDIVLSVFKNVVNNNEIAVLNIGNEDAVLRKISYTNHGIIIYGINITEHQPHFYSNSELKTTPIKVIGKVVEIRRKL